MVLLALTRPAILMTESSSLGKDLHSTYILLLLLPVTVSALITKAATTTIYIIAIIFIIVDYTYSFSSRGLWPARFMKRRPLFPARTAIGTSPWESQPALLPVRRYFSLSLSLTSSIKGQVPVGRPCLTEAIPDPKRLGTGHRTHNDIDCKHYHYKKILHFF